MAKMLARRLVEVRHMQARARELRGEYHSQMDTDTGARSKTSMSEEDQEQRMPLQQQRQHETPALTTLRGVQVLPLAPPRPASISWLSTGVEEPDGLSTGFSPSFLAQKRPVPHEPPKKEPNVKEPNDGPKTASSPAPFGGIDGPGVSAADTMRAMPLATVDVAATKLDGGKARRPPSDIIGAAFFAMGTPSMGWRGRSRARPKQISAHPTRNRGANSAISAAEDSAAAMPVSVSKKRSRAAPSGTSTAAERSSVSGPVCMSEEEMSIQEAAALIAALKQVCARVFSLTSVNSVAVLTATCMYVCMYVCIHILLVHACMCMHTRLGTRVTDGNDDARARRYRQRQRKGHRAPTMRQHAPPRILLGQRRRGVARSARGQSNRGI